jgi:hypothetical protein
MRCFLAGDAIEQYWLYVGLWPCTLNDPIQVARSV